MIRIDITATAFDAILATMPLGSAAYEARRGFIHSADSSRNPEI
jgi:hypothetical protein